MRTFVLLFLVAAATANAGIVSINAADHPTGTDVSTLLPGAKMSEVTNYLIAGGYAVQPTFAVPNLWATGIGPNFIGHNNAKPSIARYDFRNLLWGAEPCLAGGACPSAHPWEIFNALRISFTAPTDFVEVRAHFNQMDLDGAILRAFNSAGDLLMTCRVWGDIPPRHPQYGLYPTTTSPVCGKLLRRYECSSSGTWCKSEYRAFIRRSYPDIAYVLWGGESDSATGSAINYVAYRRFSSDCAP
jgi:hypothetical protein